MMCYGKKKRNVLPSHKAHRAGLVHRAVCLITSQLSLVVTAPTHGGMARLS